MDDKNYIDQNSEVNDLNESSIDYGNRRNGDEETGGQRDRENRAS